MNQKNNLVKNASFLMVAAMISKVIGLLYKSPLSSIVGNMGMGYISLAQNAYMILLMIASFSIPQAVSKLISERIALKDYKNAQKIFHGSLIYAAIVGGIVALVCLFGVGAVQLGGAFLECLEVGFLVEDPVADGVVLLTEVCAAAVLLEADGGHGAQHLGDALACLLQTGLGVGLAGDGGHEIRLQVQIAVVGPLLGGRLGHGPHPVAEGASCQSLFFIF